LHFLGLTGVFTENKAQNVMGCLYFHVFINIDELYGLQTGPRLCRRVCHFLKDFMKAVGM
jgi:hypothetical protein